MNIREEGGETGGREKVKRTGKNGRQREGTEREVSEREVLINRLIECVTV